MSLCCVVFILESFLMTRPRVYGDIFGMSRVKASGPGVFPVYLVTLTEAPTVKFALFYQFLTDLLPLHLKSSKIACLGHLFSFSFIIGLLCSYYKTLFFFPCYSVSCKFDLVQREEP